MDTLFARAYYTEQTTNKSRFTSQVYNKFQSSSKLHSFLNRSLPKRTSQELFILLRKWLNIQTNILSTSLLHNVQDIAVSGKTWNIHSCFFANSCWNRIVSIAYICIRCLPANWLDVCKKFIGTRLHVLMKRLKGCFTRWCMQKNKNCRGWSQWQIFALNSKIRKFSLCLVLKGLEKLLLVHLNISYSKINSTFGICNHSAFFVQV